MSYFDKDGYCWLDQKSEIYYKQLRISNRLGWLEKIKSKSKYEPHQGKQECQRRLKSILK